MNEWCYNLLQIISCHHPIVVVPLTWYDYKLFFDKGMTTNNLFIFLSRETNNLSIELGLEYDLFKKRENDKRILKYVQALLTDLSFFFLFFFFLSGCSIRSQDPYNWVGCFPHTLIPLSANCLLHVGYDC